MRFLLFVLLSLSVGFLFAQTPRWDAQEPRQLIKTLQQYHLQPRKIDDRFSQDVFSLLLKELDAEKIYFTKAEIQTLQTFEFKIDDELNGKSWNFLKLLAETYRQALQRALETLQDACDHPFDIARTKKISADTLWVDNTDALRDRWKNMLSIEVMADMAKDRTVESALSEISFLKKAEPLARGKIKLSHQRRIQKHLEPATGYEKQMTTRFLRTVAAVFDPHSLYLSPTQMENFMASLSTEGYYLGIDVKTNDRGEMFISGLLPGGPAWKSGQINSGDRLEKVRWEGKEWIEIAGMDENELAELLAAFNHNVIQLLIRKAGGLEKIVTLQKEKVNTEENIVRSFVLEGSKKIGYVSLPDFYSDWGEQERSKSANDVAKEILKLKKENIQGLILDLRFNGGGSMGEALAMAGIFIDAGPVGILQERGQELLTLKDSNRGTVYDGPLVIMINGLSASASEFLAAALQDYRRAIIVGSPSFGKAVAQGIFALETGKPVADYQNLNSKKGWGYSTITTSRLYRVNGRSIQQSGVIPDIMYPDLYDLYEARESRLPFSMIQDSVIKKTYYQQDVLFPLPELREKSQNRIAANVGFQRIQAFIGTVQSQVAARDWETMKRNMAVREKQYAELVSAMAAPVQGYQVNLHEFGKSRMQFDEYARLTSEGWLKNLSQDVSLEEAFHIICDFIDTLERK